MVIEQELNIVVQHIICLLHLNELPFRHELCAVDGVTSGQGKYTYNTEQLCVNILLQEA